MHGFLLCLMGFREQDRLSRKPCRSMHDLCGWLSNSSYETSEIDAAIQADAAGRHTSTAVSNLLCCGNDSQTLQSRIPSCASSRSVGSLGLSATYTCVAVKHLAYRSTRTVDRERLVPDCCLVTHVSQSAGDFRECHKQPIRIHLSSFGKSV